MSRIRLSSLVSLLSLIAAPAMGVVQINWFTIFPEEVLQSDGATAAPAGWLAQLIWSPDPLISELDVTNPLVPTGGEQVLEAQPLNTGGTPGRIIGPVTPNNEYSNSYTNGFLYTRVFNVNFGDSVGEGNLYGESTNILGPLEEFDNLDLTTAANFFPEGIVVNQLIVPEPSTALLFAFGGAVAVWRRRRSLAI